MRNANQKYKSGEEWYDLVKQCIASGKTYKDWCQEQGISTSTWEKALRRLRKKGYTIPDRRIKEKRKNVGPHPIKITMGNIHISVSNEADLDLLEKTISLLRQPESGESIK